MADYKKIQDGILQAESKFHKLNMGGGPLNQDPEKDRRYRPTLESRHIKKKGVRVRKRCINRLEIRVNTHNYLHPSIIKVEITSPLPPKRILDK